MIKILNKETFVLCILLAAATFGVYSRVLSNGFINFDDNEYITNNQNVQGGFSIENVKWAFTTNTAANWHPVTWLSHMLDCELFGLRAWGHHLVSLLLHIANVLLLFWVLKAMTGAIWRSAFVAAVFALHPLNVESVAWVAERKNVLSTFFWILVMMGYWQSVKEKSVRWYVMTLILFALGLMAKPMLVTLPFVLLLMDYWPLERIKDLREGKVIGRLVIEKVPFFVLSIISSVVTFFEQRSLGAVLDAAVMPINARVANALVSYVKYIEMMFWPSKLAIFYLLDDKKIPVKEAVMAGVLLIAVTVLVIKLSAKRRYPAFGWFWYIGTMVPVIGLVQVGEQAMADRYAYVPLIGLFIIVAWGAAEILKGWRHQKILLGAAAIIVFGCLSVKTFEQIKYWKNGVTVFEHAVKVTKNNRRAYYSLGCAYDNAGDYAKAEGAFKEAIKIKADYYEAIYNLGILYNKIGRFDDAIGTFEQTIKVRPDFAEAYNGWGAGLVYLSRKKEGEERRQFLTEAKEKCLKAEAIKVGGGAYNLACIYALLGDKEKCRKWLKVGEKAGTLEKRKYAFADSDLESVRNEGWFGQIRWSDDGGQ